MYKVKINGFNLIALPFIQYIIIFCNSICIDFLMKGYS